MGPFLGRLEAVRATRASGGRRARGGCPLAAGVLVSTAPPSSSTRSARASQWLELVWADGGYNARQVDQAVAKVPDLRIEIVKRSDDMTGFVVLPRRWVVERTFSWFGRNRRLAKDYENLADTLLAFVTLASIQLALRRLARG
jgi:transposase